MAVENSSAIGFLATGDELLQGDIVNTNSQQMVNMLMEHGLQPGQQLLVGDRVNGIVDSLRFLLNRHAVVITTGGLGPTSDDVTRDAVALLLNVKLEYLQASWQRLHDRLSSRGLHVSENNRQQCYFPAGAKVMVNANGTADGFIVTIDKKCLMVLPGPPRECVPMLKEEGLAFLMKRGLSRPVFCQRWLLMGLGESAIASRVTPLLRGYRVRVGYRASYPYCEVKLFSDQKSDILSLIDRIEVEFEHAIVSRDKRTARELLLDFLLRYDKRLCIVDEVTRGLLSSSLSNQGERSRVDFRKQEGVSYDCELTVTGLDRFWLGEELERDELLLTFLDTSRREVKVSVRLYADRTLEWVREYVCWQCLLVMTHEDKST